MLNSLCIDMLVVFCRYPQRPTVTPPLVRTDAVWSVQLKSEQTCRISVDTVTKQTSVKVSFQVFDVDHDLTGASKYDYDILELHLASLDGSPILNDVQVCAFLIVLVSTCH